MKPRNSLIFLAAGLNVSWLVAAGWGTQGSAAEPASPEVIEKSTEPPATPPAPETPPTPKVSSPPTAVPSAVVPLVPGEAAPEPPAGSSEATEAAASAIPPPDGMDVSGGNPLPVSPDDLATDTATPFSLPVAGSLDGMATPGNADNPKPAAETAPAATDDRTAPWVAAPGGFSIPSAAGFGGGLPFAPSGFTSANPGFPRGGITAGEGILDGFSIAATFSGTYTSNATSSPGEPFAPIQDDFIFGLGGSVSYLSKATEWTFGGSYSGNYNQYLELSDYSGYNQSLTLLGNYEGSKLTAALTGSVSYDQGTNRYYSSEFVQQTSFNLGLNLRYKLSTKTSLQGNIGQNFSTTSESSFNDRESFNLGVASLWKYSKLTEFGPGIRYTFLSSGSQDSRTSVGPEMLVNYKLATKVSLNSRVGVEFAQYENGGSADPTLTGSIGFVYTASRLWSMNLSIYRGTQAEASSANVFTDVSSVRLGYVHKIRRATLNLGVGYELNSYQTTGAAPAAGYQDRNYFNLDGSLGIPVFANTCFASIFLQYNDQSGSPTDSWNGVQSGFSISRRF